MSTLRTDNLQTTDSSFTIPVKSLSGFGKSLVDFGASPTDLDHSQAFQNAWASSGTVIIPDGTWYVKSLVGSLTVGSSVKFVGSPNAKVVLSNTGGFAVTGQGWSFDGFTINPSGVVPFAIKTGVVGDNQRWSISNMRIYSTAESGSYFNQVVDLYGAWYGSMHNNYIRNNGTLNFSQGVLQGQGVRFNFCVNNAITSNVVGGCVTGVEVSGVQGVNGNVCEGLMFGENIILCNRTHVRVLDGLLINFSNCVLDVTQPGDYPVVLKASCSTWSDNWINVADFPMLLGAGPIHGGQRNVFSSNSWIAANGAGSLLTTVSGELCALNKVALNQFFGGVSGLGLSGGDDSWDISENIFVGQSAQAYDTSLGTKIRLSRNRAAPGSSRIIATGSHIEPISHTLATTLAFPATASGTAFTINVPITSSPYNLAPDFANLVTDGSSQLIVRYVKAASSKDTLVFNAISINTAVLAGNYNVFVESKSVTDAY